MNSESTPQEMHAWAQALTTSVLNQVIAAATQDGYMSIWQALCSEERLAIKHNHIDKSKALWLLANACGMFFNPSDREPFYLCTVRDESMVILPEEFTEMDIKYLKSIAAEIDNAFLRARIYDVLWLKSRHPGEVDFALNAIDAYCSIPIDTETWRHGGRECWLRAFSLARMRNAKSRSRLEHMEKVIDTAFDASGRENGLIALWLAIALRTNKRKRCCVTKFSKKLESLAHEFSAAGDYKSARDFFYESAQWCRINKDDIKESEIRKHAAETWVEEAIGHTKSDPPNYMAALICYESAIQAYRKIKSSEKKTKSILNARLRQLELELNEVSTSSMNQMEEIPMPVPDISRI